MAESIKNSDNNSFRIFSTPSNEHLVFAETLRDWRDPLLHGYDPIPVPLCPRCMTCKCESLKNFRNVSLIPIHHDHNHHHKHEPSCPNFRHQHQRAKTPNQQRTMTKSKRRAISHDPSITIVNTSSSSSSIIKSKSAEHSPLLQLNDRKKSLSKIPVRVSTPISNYSLSSPSSINKTQSSNKKTKIPRLILTPSLSLSPKTTDDLYELDSLNDDADRTSQIISDNETTSLKEKQNIKTNYPHQLNNMDEQVLTKKKKKHKHNKSILDKRQRRGRYKEGRHSKSKSTSNDLLTSSSLSSSSSSSQSISPLRKKSHSSHRRLSKSQNRSSSSSSHISEKLQSSQNCQHSILTSTDPTNYLSPKSSSSSSSIYLIQLTNTNNQINSFGLTKTIPYVWKNTNININDEENNIYPKYSIEQIPPIIHNKKRSIPILSRNIILQRGQIDYWQNFDISPDSILTSSCQNLTGSASHLLFSSSSSSSIQQTKNSNHSQGNIISITTTKRYQPSLLNKTKYIKWNIEGNGKQLQYSKTKWHSDHQLHKHNRLKKNTYPKKSLSDNHTDTGSSSEQNNRSTPLIFHSDNNNSNHLNKTHEVLEKSSMNTNTKQIDSIVPDNSLSNCDKNNISLSKKSNEKTNYSLSKSLHKSKSKSKPISYASTDEDVDEINSHYFEDIDRPTTTTIEDYREKLNTRLLSLNNEQNENHINLINCSKILSTEYSQITIDSGVDIESEQKIYQPNITLTIDEQSSELITDHNDLFLLTDNSFIEKQSIKIIEQESICSMKNNLYKTYELETISDDDDEDNNVIKNNSNELIITTENSTLINHSTIIPSQFEFKLPTFGEWIDRAFTVFLSDTNQYQNDSILSSRSSSIVSIPTSQSTINTSSSSQIITVLDNFNLSNISKDNNSDFHQTQTFIHQEEQDDEHSLNGKD
ncbi:unnamed protein product [Rotaria sp. Silwood1]|nr:unnamed protein product [Rotaria sp. Silwood1]